MFVSRLALIAIALTVPCVASPINAALAANGSLVTQSSTSFGGLATLATDGIIDGDFGHGSVTSTDTEQGAWWKVTFDASYILSTINIYNRTDGQGDLINPFSVFLYDENDVEVWSSLGNRIDDPASLAAFTNLNIGVKSLRVQLEGANYLQLAEVQAWTGESGPPPEGGEVPEPATCALIAGGLAGLGLLHRHKQCFLFK
jgi:hypothetical protein